MTSFVRLFEIVVVGGVEALISLSDLNDRETDSQIWSVVGTRRTKHRSNNSVNYKEKPDVGTFTRWLSLYDSKSGERGIYNGLSVNEL